MPVIMRSACTFLHAAAAAAILMSLGVAARAEPAVVVTVKPIHSLIAAVMEGVGEPILLIDGGTSPHGFTLRPSQADALQEADLIVWVGPGLESALDRSIETLAGDAAVLTLMELQSLALLAYDSADHGDRGGDGHDEHAHEEHGHEEHAEDHHDEPAHDDHGHSGDYDPHLWMDPENGIAVAAAAAEMLADIDPDNAAAYRANAARIDGDLTALTAALSARLAPFGDRPFIVFHDAFGYFRMRFGLTRATAMVVNPEVPPGVRRLEALREEIVEEGITCAFTEPQFAPRVLTALTDGLDVRIGTLDPIGADLDAGPGLYAALLNWNAEALASCLEGAG